MHCMTVSSAQNTTAEDIYKDYWDNSESRDKRRYYERLYSHLTHKITFPKHQKILDVAGGNGQNLAFFKISNADVLDISDSGLAIAQKRGYTPIKGDIQKRFPMAENQYDIALCFEVLEHLHYPAKTLVEINNVLKKNAVLYVAQPNMKPDGKIHVRRYYQSELTADLKKSGFTIEWIDYVPAYTMREAILSDIRNNPSLMRKMIQCVNLTLSYLPWKIRYKMAHLIPDRFALMVVVKAVKAL